MVQISTIFIAVVAAFTPLAAAAVCERDISYCGSRLMAVDSSYENVIVQLLQSRGVPITNTNKQDSLFYCNDDLSVDYWTFCGEGQCYVDTKWGDQCPN